MRSRIHWLAAATSLAGLGQVDAFWRMSCEMVQVGRIDPVISFGAVANHVHKIAGASNIGISSTYDSLMEAECTSCTVQADRSAYWTPALYYQHADGTFEEVANTGMAVYYLGRGADAHGKKQASPFPPGLKMLSGNNVARTQDVTKRTYGNSSYPSRPVSEAVSMACINYTPGLGSETANMTNMNCPQGFRAQIHMQTCWDGKNLYLPDQSHVAHLSQIDNGVCPPTHPVLLPHLFYEVFYEVNPFVGGGGRFVFANGDTTGFGFHGDFQNGWDIPTLTKAIDQCLTKNANGVVEDCPAFAASNNPRSAAMCPERSPVYPCEQTKGRISKLPGCITPTGYGHVVTPADITCAGGNVVGCDEAVSNAPRAWAGDSTYAPLGCYTEASSGRALTGKSYSSATNMTAGTCRAFCYGHRYFGVEYGRECYCGNALGAGAAPTGPSECSMACTGDRWELCGAGSRLGVFEMNSTLYEAPAVPTAWGGDGSFAPLGCYTEASGGRALGAKSYSDGGNMTAQNCAAFCAGYSYFGVEWSRECFCGNALNKGAVPAGAGECSSLCTGNKLQYCGGGSRLNVYRRRDASSSSSSSSASSPSRTSAAVSTSATSAPATSSSSVTSRSATPTPTTLSSVLSPSAPSSSSLASRSTSLSATSSTAVSTSSPQRGVSTKYPSPETVGTQSLGLWTYRGCYTEASSGRALSGKQLYGSASSSVGNMDLETCAGFCLDGGYGVFGVEYGQECYCGNSLGAGSALAGDQDECSTRCPGNGSQFCGAGKRLNVYALVAGSGFDPATGFSLKYANPAKVDDKATTTTTGGVWEYTGCYTEAASGRALSAARLSGPNMTIETCVRYCAGKGTSMAGVEYGRECYCGDRLNAGAVWATNQNECSTRCVGDSAQYCGAGARLSLYVLRK